MSEEFLSSLDKQAREWAEDRDKTKRVGLWMAVFLAASTIVEYALAISIDRNLPIMVAINIAEAAAILWFFMHVRRAWRSEDH